MEFPGIIFKGYKMPEDGTFFVMEEDGKILGVQLESVKLIEIYYDDNIPWRHYIDRAEILSGNPSKIKYEKIVWKSFENIESGDFNLYGKQVYQKIAECTYCRKLCEKKAELDIFYDEYMAQDAGMFVSNVIKQAGDSEDIYKMAIRYYFSQSLVIEIWFYAGELGADIGNPDPAVAVFMDVNRQELLEMVKEKFNDKE